MRKASFIRFKARGRRPVAVFGVAALLGLVFAGLAAVMSPSLLPQSVVYADKPTAAEAVKRSEAYCATHEEYKSTAPAGGGISRHQACERGYRSALLEEETKWDSVCKASDIKGKSYDACVVGFKQGLKEVEKTTLEDAPDPSACAADPHIKGCDSATNSICDQNGCDIVAKYINPGIQLLSIVFGLIAAISLIMGGIQYSASTGDSQKVQAAKTRLKLTVAAIVAYAFLYSFLQFLIPGGAF